MPVIPEGAGIVAPVTEEEKDATRLFLGFVAELIDVAHGLHTRAETAREGC